MGFDVDAALVAQRDNRVQRRFAGCFLFLDREVPVAARACLLDDEQHVDRRAELLGESHRVVGSQVAVVAPVGRNEDTLVHAAIGTRHEDKPLGQTLNGEHGC